MIIRLIALMLLGLSSVVLADDTPSKPEERIITPTDGPIPLFDGKTLGNCYTWLKDTRREDPRRVFRVTDRLLHITGDGMGSLITTDSFHDYHLVLEFRWGEKTWPDRERAARDSGLLIHSNGADGGYRGTWIPSLEVQIIEGGVGDFILVNGNDKLGKPMPISLTCNVTHDPNGQVVWQANGPAENFDAKNRHRINWFGRDPDWKDTIGFRGPHDVENPHGKWNRLDVFADHDRVRVFANGTLVNEAQNVVPNSGRLQLQSELAEIYFRRWELWPLNNGPEPKPAEQ
jgi:3-keto-disaccharide hydrolase